MAIIIRHADSKFFSHFMTAALLLNTAVAAWGSIDSSHVDLAEHVETGLLVLFLGELLLRARSDWRSPGFAFDAALIALGLLLPLLSAFPLPTPVLRIAGISRLARLVHLGRHHFHHISALRTIRLDATVVVGVILAVAAACAGSALLEL